MLKISTAIVLTSLALASLTLATSPVSARGHRTGNDFSTPTHYVEGHTTKRGNYVEGHYSSRAHYVREHTTRQGSDVEGHFSNDDGPKNNEAKIGRASCRERV